MGFIYLITGPDGKQYIGQTTRSVEERWYNHVRAALNNDEKRSSCYLAAAIHKHGKDSFAINTVLQCSDELLDYHETRLIDQCNTLRPNGYNIKLGGAHGRHSDETRKKISEAQQGKPRPASYVEWHRRNNSLKKDDQSLPMYVIEYKRKGVLIGYQVCNHPHGKYKAFLSSKLSLEEKKQLAIAYKESLDNESNVQRLNGTGERNAS